MSSWEKYESSPSQEATSDGLLIVPIDPFEIATNALAKLKAAGHSGIITVTEPLAEIIELREAVEAIEIGEIAHSEIIKVPKQPGHEIGAASLERVDLRIGDSQFSNEELGLSNQHEVALLKLLPLLNGQPLTRKWAMAQGFFPEASSSSSRNQSYSTCVAGLCDKLQAVFGAKVLERIGERAGSRYLVQTPLTINSLEVPVTNKDAKDTIVRRKRQLPKLAQAKTRPGRILASPDLNYDDQHIAEHYISNYKKRDAEFLKLLAAYKDHPATSRLLRSVENPRHRQQFTGDIAEDYLSATNKYRLLERHEIADLFKRMNKGLTLNMQLDGHEPSEEEDAILADATACYWVVYSCNTKLITSRAIKFPGVRDKMFMDYVQEGNIGLGLAIRRFDYRKGFTFSTYTTWWLKQSLTRAEANQSRAIRLPVHMNEKLYSLKIEIKALTIELGREPTIDEIAANTSLDLKPDKVFELIRAGRKELRSLNEPLGEDSDMEFGDLLSDSDDEFEQSSDDLDRQMMITSIFESRAISAQEKAVLSLRFGIYSPFLEGYSLRKNGKAAVYENVFKDVARHFETAGRTGKKAEFSLEAIGKAMGLQRERVRYILDKAILKLEQSEIAEQTL